MQWVNPFPGNDIAVIGCHYHALVCSFIRLRVWILNPGSEGFSAPFKCNIIGDLPGKPKGENTTDPVEGMAFPRFSSSPGIGDLSPILDVAVDFPFRLWIPFSGSPWLGMVVSPVSLSSKKPFSLC